MKKGRQKADTRVYICHTFYHVYVSAVKELSLKTERGTGPHSNAPSGTEQGTVGCGTEDESSTAEKKADIILSTMSNDFGSLKERLEASGIFRAVYLFDEKEDTTSEEVMRYHYDRGNLLLNLFQRIKYTRLLGKLQEPFLPVNLSAYRDIYVFCDSDPIGYYLNYKKLPYHAVEDGLNSGKLDDQAHLANLGAWGVKKRLAKWGLIFIESGYSRYCIDYEVNDFSANHSLPENAVELPRNALHEKLTAQDREKLVQIFLEHAEELKAQLKEKNASGDRPYAMVLTEPLCELDVRKKLFGDIITEYEKDHTVVIKPHPRDLLDYEKEFPDTIVIKDKFPMEVLNDIEGFRIRKLISVITQIDEVGFADEIVYLGLDFLDRYEDPSIHRKTELLPSLK